MSRLIPTFDVWRQESLRSVSLEDASERTPTTALCVTGVTPTSPEVLATVVGVTIDQSQSAKNTLRSAELAQNLNAKVLAPHVTYSRLGTAQISSPAPSLVTLAPIFSPSQQLSLRESIRTGAAFNKLYMSRIFQSRDSCSYSGIERLPDKIAHPHGVRTHDRKIRSLPSRTQRSNSSLSTRG